MISIIIPAYNRADLIGDTIRSLLSQTVPAGEIIVVDDGSTDSTAAVASSFGNPVRVIRQANGGPAVARNRGVAESKGEFIHFFDSDDIALANKHEVQLSALIKHKADVAVGPWVKGYFYGKSFVSERQVLQQNGLPKGDLVKALMTNWAIVPHACLFRREIVEKVGGFPEDCFGTEDTFFFLDVLLAGAKVVHSSGTLELYRLGNEKITNDSSNGTKHLHEWSKVLLKMQHRCLDEGIDATKWYGFRARAFSAGAALKKLRPEDKDLITALDAIPTDVAPGVYKAGNWLTTKWGGIRNRLMGGRARASFRPGKLTADQIGLIRQSGYQPDIR